jgi:4-hydroxythreonine-4-phosphate dehydrogenase
MGDPAGIGGELILKALMRLTRRSIPVIIGDARVLESLSRHMFHGTEFRMKPLGQASAGEAEFVDLGVMKGEVRLGLSDAACGAASYHYLREALKLVFSGSVSAVVTCPINKKSIRSAGMPFPGHTELFAHYAGVTDYVMMMQNRSLRVCLVTIHTPLKDVPALITPERVFTCIVLTNRSLKVDFGIASPYLRVCGLNPHAGEQGVMGDEERAITKAINRASASGMRVEGPIAADSLFHAPGCDACIAMYHDQGLIPVKTLDFRRTVNITLGLPLVRTSVGHGTGLDIAGKGEADPTSLIEAYRVAESIVAVRSRAGRRGEKDASGEGTTRLAG